MTAASNFEPQEDPEVEEAPVEPELKEVDNIVSQIRYAPDPCSTCS